MTRRRVGEAPGGEERETRRLGDAEKEQGVADEGNAPASQRMGRGACSACPPDGRLLSVSPCQHWLMSEAKYPAPNPLSMFTTATPGAQELSMARRAASPLKEAP